MRSSQTTLLAAVAWASLGAAACDSSPTSQSTSPLENGAVNPADSSKTTDPTSCATGGSSGSPSCKTATDATGAACKVCWDASGAIIFDDCGSGGSGGAGGTAGAGGTSGAGGSVVKCGTTTDPTTNAECQICYNPDGTVASTDCKTPPGSGSGGSGGSSGSGGTGGSDVTCTATTDATGVVCKVCLNADGTVLSKDCTPAPTPSPTISCVAATDIDSGQLCKVCSDTTGKVLFVDCDGEPPPSTSPPPSK